MEADAIRHLKNTFEELSTDEINLMMQHLQLILHANETTNLTRITDNKSAVILHIEDSLIGLPEMNAAPEGLYADLGSGGGYPGIPLSIVTGRSTLLIDSVKKKMEILDSIVSDLGLTGQIRTYNGRVEELSIEKPGEFAVATARALSSLPSLLELSSPLLFISGRLICYKAQLLDSELSQAKAIETKTGMKMYSERNVTLSDNKTTRKILVFEKVSEPTAKLPRRPGMAQKRPYTS